MSNAPTAITTIAERDFPAERRELAGIREFIAAQAGDLPAAGDLILAGSELAANAIEHGSGGRPDASVTVTVTVTGDMIRVDVTDSDPAGMPRLSGAYADDEASRGRGLLIVAALGRWGCDFTGRSKTVWCEMATAPELT